MKRFGIVVAAAVVFGSMELHAQPPATTAGAVNYARPFEPPTRPALLSLPPGAVEPEGWLRDWCLAAKNGYTGHMDEVHEAFRQAWAADYKMTGQRLAWPKGAWPYEGGGYWFDGLVRLGYALHDEALIGQARRRFDVVVTHTNPNGILFLWWLDKNSPEDVSAVTKGSGSWSIWASGLLGRGMSGYYAGSHDAAVLRALETAYSGEGDWIQKSTPSNLWGAFDTYTWTGNRALAKKLTALFALDGKAMGRGGDFWNRYRKPPSAEPGTENNDHVVHFLESTTPWVLGYLWTGNREALDAVLGWHDLLQRVAMQPSGVPVADEWYGPTGAFRGTETCDVAGYVWSKAMLLLVTGDGAMGDRMERALFNAGPATVTRDFKKHVYFQSPNRMVPNSPIFDHGPRAEGGNYESYHYPLCCTAALNRILPWYVTHMWTATYDNGLAATCYGPCRVRALVGKRVPVVIDCKTDYPFTDTIEMTVAPEKETAFPLLLRIPAWCKEPSLRVNGEQVVLGASEPGRVGPGKPGRNAPAQNNEHAIRDGFVRIDRTWKSGDTVSLRFPMTPVVATGFDRAKGTAPTHSHHAIKVYPPEANPAPGRPYATVSYGPLLFALAIRDTTDANTPDPAARWKYALDTRNPEITVGRHPMPAQWDWPLAAPLRMTVNAMPIDWEPDWKDPALPAAPFAKDKASQRITLIPYGCTKFRVSMFPVAERRR